MVEPRAPGPRGLPVEGSALALRGDAFGTLLGWQRRYGDVVRYRLGPKVFHMIGHPALAEEVLISRQERFVKSYEPDNPKGLALVLGQGLVTSRGDLWQRQRRLLQPEFHRSRVAGFGDAIAAVGRGVDERWGALAPGEPVAVDREMMRATLEIITRTMFSTSVLDRLDALSPALGTVLRYCGEHLRNPLLPPLWLPTPGNRALRRALGWLDDLVYGLIRARRASGRRHDDLLDKLLHATDGGAGPAMGDRQIRDEVLTIFIAGHETTAVALSWTWFLLAAHPKARERLWAELDAALPDVPPRVEDLSRLPFTRAVFEESLRLFPPAVGVLRQATGETRLGGARVPAQSMVFVNIANIQRHSGFWEEPDSFRPERFLEGRPAPGHRLAFMPFGAGPRVCLGNHFAYTEALLLLATLARRFRLDLPQGARVEPEILLTLRPKGGLRMLLSPRRPSAASDGLTARAEAFLENGFAPNRRAG